MMSKPAKWIEEYKDVLVGRPKQFRCELVEFTETAAVVIYQLQNKVVLEETCMPAGTISFGYFWQERNYNIYHFLSTAGQTLGFYFNISDSTQIDETRIYWRDLVVDIFITPDGICRVPDEDEVPEDISTQLSVLIDQTRDHILEQSIQIIDEVDQTSRVFLAARFK